MAKQSAGILVFRRGPELEFFLIHPGGPFTAGKDEGIWSIPKGEFTDEDPFDAAIREFQEETGFDIEGTFHLLAPVVQKGGKHVQAWAVEGNFDEKNIVSNTFIMEWPYKSGRFVTFPEVDKAGWFNLETARKKINSAQISFLDEVAREIAPKND